MTGQFGVRIGNFSPDAPPVDVYVDGYPVLTDVAFGDLNDYTHHRADRYDVAVKPSGEEATLLETSITFEPGRNYTLLFVGPVAELESRLLVDESFAG